MNSELWLKTSFEKPYIPDWPCPYCGGRLEFNHEHFRTYETERSQNPRRLGDFYPEDTEYLFHGILRCSESICIETIIYCGTGGVESRWEPNDDTGEMDSRYYEFFIPKYFIPSLHLFQIKDKCPKEVKDDILAAFNLFWCDYSACANRIRTVVERILDNLQVPSESERSNTHGRLLTLKKDEPEIADHLLALKWIGNAGSHNSEITRQDLVDGFEILDYCLEKLYYSKERQIKALTKAINKNSGPRSKPKS